MKIVFVSHSGSLRAGAEISFLETVRNLARNGHSVHATLPRDGELAQELRSLAIPVAIIPFGWWVSTRKSWTLRLRRIFRNLPAASYKLAKLFKQIRPDLVVTNTLTIGAAALASKSCGIPHIWYIHEFGEEDHCFHFDLG